MTDPLGALSGGQCRIDASGIWIYEGNDIPFTATYKGKFDAKVQSSVAEAGDDNVVVDVEAEVVAD